MRKLRKLVLAVPVTPTDTLEKLRNEVADLNRLEDYVQFGAIGIFYADSQQVPDAEVIDIMARRPTKTEASSK